MNEKRHSIRDVSCTPEAIIISIFKWLTTGNTFGITTRIALNVNKLEIDVYFVNLDYN